MLDLVTLGESMVLFVPTGSGPLRHARNFRRFVAGAESNTAIGMARLGLKAGWISRLGKDEFGRTILNTIREEGVDVSKVIPDEHAPSGVFFKEFNDDTATNVYYYRAGSAASRLTPEDLHPEYISKAKYFHFSGITPALSPSCFLTILEAIKIARQAKLCISFDPNVRLKLWSLEQAKRFFDRVVPEVDLVLVNDEEIAMLTGENDIVRAARHLTQIGPSLVVIKMGVEGALAVSKKKVLKEPAMKVQAIDTVGAGDAFNAGFLSAQLKGLPIALSLRLGNILGGCATTRPGDIEGLPYSANIQDLLNEYSCA